jgi:hypothetical protein
LSISTVPPLHCFQFLVTFFHRIEEVSLRPANESLAEAVRCFHLIATANLSSPDSSPLPSSSVKEKFVDVLRGKESEAIPVDVLITGLRGMLRIPAPSQTNPQSQISPTDLQVPKQDMSKKILEIESEKESGKSESEKSESGKESWKALKGVRARGTIVDNESTSRLEQLLRALERNSDKNGMISLVSCQTPFMLTPF